MRTAFIQQLSIEARKHPNVFLLVADLGFSVVEPFAREFPKRYLNVGVAEQNMTGVAAGLASEGYHVFTYSIANFPTLRCLEQIRNDVCYHGLPVTVVSVGGGLAYGNLGYSHHAVQDLAIMRTLPGNVVFAPADPGETAESVQWLVKNPGPSYLRLGKAGEPKLHDLRGVDTGPIKVIEGSATCALVSTGGMLKTAIDAAKLLEVENQRVPVFSLPRLKPISHKLLESLHGFTSLIALEEHVGEGGLAAALRENLPSSVVVYSAALPEIVVHQVGTQDYLRTQGGLSAKDIALLWKVRSGVN